MMKEGTLIGTFKQEVIGPPVPAVSDCASGCCSEKYSGGACIVVLTQFQMDVWILLELPALVMVMVIYGWYLLCRQNLGTSPFSVVFYNVPRAPRGNVPGKYITPEAGWISIWT